MERPDEGALSQDRGAGVGGAESVAERPGAGVDQRGGPRRRGRSDPGGAGRAADPGGRRRPGDGPSALREGGVPRPVRPVGPAAGVPEKGSPRGGGVRPLPEIGRRGRHRLGRRAPVPHPHGRADRRGGEVPPADEGDPPPSGEVARALRHRDAVPAAVRGPDRQRGRPGDLPPPGADRLLPPRLPDGAGLPRGRDADDADGGGGRDGAPVRDPPQRPRHGPVPADRPGALPEAPPGRRVRARLRDQPELPERGDRHPAQPRVHDDRVLPGVRHLHGDDGR